MKGAVIRGKGLMPLEDFPDFKPDFGEVIIKISYCGICGTDVHMYNDDNPYIGYRPGHEWSGRIVELGEGVEGWKVGDRVVGGVGMPCGKCADCLQGHFSSCFNVLLIELARPGGFAEYTAQKASRLFRIPDEVSDEEAALVEPIAVGLHGVQLSGIQVGESAVILGGGPIGNAHLQFAKLCGASVVYMSEKIRSRAELAKSVGADEVFDPLEVDLVAEVRQRIPLGPDKVFECAGVGSTIQQAAELVRNQGRVLVAGYYVKPVTINPGIWSEKEIDIQMTWGYTRENYHQVLELLRQKKFNAKALISEIVPLSRLGDALKDLASPNTQMKVLVRP